MLDFCTILWMPQNLHLPGNDLLRVKTVSSVRRLENTTGLLLVGNIYSAFIRNTNSKASSAEMTHLSLVPACIFINFFVESKGTRLPCGDKRITDFQSGIK